jgi:FtsH-binding integral membrane protein
MQEAAEDDIVTNKTDELFREVSERASFLADRMEKRTNTYMILGVTMGFIGMGFWFWSFNHALSKPMGMTEFVETAIPRITILIFIELLAGFFLRQYRIGVEDFKYFFEIEQRADWKRISYSILLANKDAAIGTFAASLANEALAMKLQAGESTTTLEALKAEGNTTLEAMKLMGSTVKDVVQAVKAK